MKFSLALFAGLAGIAIAASGTSSDSASGTTTSLSPTQTCLNACKTGDVNCQAACLGLPYPNSAQTNATTECSAECVQGNGTQAETQQYASCLAGCRASYFLSTGTDFVGASTPASGASSTASASSGPAENSAAPTSSHAATETGAGATGTSTTSASQSTSSKGAAATVNIGAPFAGAAGILLAALAL